jgi:hypothetical protein
MGAEGAADEAFDLTDEEYEELGLSREDLGDTESESEEESEVEVAPEPEPHVTTEAPGFDFEAFGRAQIGSGALKASASKAAAMIQRQDEGRGDPVIDNDLRLKAARAWSKADKLPAGDERDALLYFVGGIARKAELEAQVAIPFGRPVLIRHWQGPDGTHVLERDERGIEREVVHAPEDIPAAIKTGKPVAGDDFDTSKTYSIQETQGWGADKLRRYLDANPEGYDQMLRAGSDVLENRGGANRPTGLHHR